MPSIKAPGWAGTLLPRMAALPRWRRMPILLHRWEMASPSSCPVCLARAAPSFFTSRSAPGCQPPKVSATMGRKAMPCLLYTCIGYKLPTFGEYMLVGGFLCALRAQGWVICLVRNVHFLLCIPDNFPPDKFPFGQLPPGQVPLPGKLPPGQVPPDKFPFGQVPPRGNLSGGQLSGGNLSASPIADKFK